MENHRKKCGREREGGSGPPGAQVAVGAGRVAIRLELLPQGQDLVLLISGGEAHVGAVAAWDGRAVAAETDRAYPELELKGHREGPLAAEAAETIATAAGCRCAVVAGIHQEDATRQEINQIVANVREGLSRLIAEHFRSPGPEGSK